MTSSCEFVRRLSVPDHSLVLLSVIGLLFAGRGLFVRLFVWGICGREVTQPRVAGSVVASDYERQSALLAS